MHVGIAVQAARQANEYLPGLLNNMVVCQNESFFVDHDTTAVGVRQGVWPGQIGLLGITFRVALLDQDAGD